MLGEHKWKKDDVSLVVIAKQSIKFTSHLSPSEPVIYIVLLIFQEGSAKVECRYDWHQTATHVTVAIYAKKYDPDISKIEAHSVRLRVHVYFPDQAGSFDLDLELGGVSKSLSSTFSSEIVISFIKAASKKCSCNVHVIYRLSMSHRRLQLWQVQN